MPGSGLLGALGNWLARGPAPGLLRPRLLLLGEPAGPVAAVAESVGAGLRLLQPTGYDGGVAVVDEEVDSGTDLVLLAGSGDSAVVAATVAVAALTGTEPVTAVGFGLLDDQAWVRRTVAVRDGLLPVAGLADDPVAMLAALGDPVLAMATGVLAQAVARRTPVLLDGLVAVAAALLARQSDPGLPRWVRLAGRSAEPAHGLAADALRMSPILDLDRPGRDGLAALLVLPVLRAGLLLRQPAG